MFLIKENLLSPLIQLYEGECLKINQPVRHVIGGFARLGLTHHWFVLLLRCVLIRVWAEWNFVGIRKAVRKFGIIPPSHCT